MIDNNSIVIKYDDISEDYCEYLAYSNEIPQN